MALALPPAEPTLGAGESAMRQIDTVSQSRPITGRLAYGAIAGICGTLAMTSAMRLLARELAPGERYPLPPREIVERMAPRSARAATPEPAREQATMLAHFGYGAVTGALLAALSDRPSALSGAAYGVAVWAGSYLGWIPAAAVLAPANRHPGRRNALMVAAHVVWGVVLAAGLREIERAESEVFAAGDIRDRPRLTD
jgi:hypothetical protein